MARTLNPYQFLQVATTGVHATTAHCVTVRQLFMRMVGQWVMNDLSLMIMVTDSYDHGQFKKCWGPLQAFLRFYRKAVSAGKSTCFYLYCFCWRLTMGPPARLTEILQATSFRGKNQVFTYTVFAGDNGALQAVCCKTDLSRKWRP